MTRDKARKRAIRARMAKTGERSTTARHDHLDLHRQADDQTPADPGEPTDNQPRPDRIAAPSTGDAAVRRATGKTWGEWFALLDAWGAASRTHPEIARHVAETYEIEGWWAQHVTVGYERARGMRAVNQRPDGFSVNASKTVGVPVERLYAAFVEDARRDAWLEAGTVRLRTAQPNRSARFDVIADGTRLHVHFTAKGEAKASVAVQQVTLAGAGEVAPWRAFWKERLDRLATVLAREDPG